MITHENLSKLRRVITENLRVQRGGDPIDYVNVGTALSDACSRQNHVVFARRGCGKTLLLHHSSRELPDASRSIYLNCEDFKRHTFPNVLIEILVALFKELDANLSGWFGRKARTKQIISDIIQRLSHLQTTADLHSEDCSQNIDDRKRQSCDSIT